MVQPAPGIVAIESLGIIFYFIPFAISLYWLITRFNAMKMTRRIFYILLFLFSAVRIVHISLSFARAEHAYPFSDKSLAVRNGNLIVWTAVLGVYLLYSAIVMIVYEWAKLLTHANLESTTRVKTIAATVIILFNVQYFILLIVQTNSPHKTEAIAYASVCIVSILTLVPSLFYYLKLVKTLKSNTSIHSTKHQRAIKLLGFIIQPITLSLLLRAAIALAVAIKGSSSFLNFYVWIIFFWMLPEWIPVAVMMIVLNPNKKNKRKIDTASNNVHLNMNNVNGDRTSSTTNLNGTSSSGNKISIDVSV